MSARLVIVISGRGSNMDAILAACANGTIAAEPQRVVSNRPAAAGLDVARRAGVPTAVVDHRAHTTRDAFDRELAAVIDAADPDWIALAGFMRILTPEFVERFRTRMINIHPSLLPAFPGLDTHERALAAGVDEHGASVHFVTSELDGGPVIAQARVPVEPDDTKERLGARVLRQEHRLYPWVLAALTHGRITWNGADSIRFDGRPLSTPLQPLETP